VNTYTIKTTICAIAALVALPFMGTACDAAAPKSRAAAEGSLQYGTPPWWPAPPARSLPALPTVPVGPSVPAEAGDNHASTPAEADESAGQSNEVAATILAIIQRHNRCHPRGNCYSITPNDLFAIQNSDFGPLRDACERRYYDRLGACRFLRPYEMEIWGYRGALARWGGWDRPSDVFDRPFIGDRDIDPVIVEPIIEPVIEPVVVVEIELCFAGRDSDDLRHLLIDEDDFRRLDKDRCFDDEDEFRRRNPRHRFDGREREDFRRGRFKRHEFDGDFFRGPCRLDDSIDDDIDDDTDDRRDEEPGYPHHKPSYPHDGDDKPSYPDDDDGDDDDCDDHDDDKNRDVCDCDDDCRDNNQCTTDACSLETHVCVHTTISCDDGNPCTTDSCDEATGCVHQAIDGCTECTADNAAVNCNDNNPCTSDSCSFIDQATVGTCSHVALPNGTNVVIDELCFSSAMCENGMVVKTPVNCGAGTTCEPFVECDPAEGCIFANASDGTPCPDDGLSCTIDECHQGVCAHLIPVDDCNPAVSSCTTACTDGDGDDPFCVNLSTSNSNCGACGLGCSVGETCCNGACRNFDTDNRNCGRCANVCDPNTPVCCGGACQAGACN